MISSWHWKQRIIEFHQHHSLHQAEVKVSEKFQVTQYAHFSVEKEEMRAPQFDSLSLAWRGMAHTQNVTCDLFGLCVAAFVRFLLMIKLNLSFYD